MALVVYALDDAKFNLIHSSDGIETSLGRGGPWYFVFKRVIILSRNSRIDIAYGIYRTASVWRSLTTVLLC